MSSGWLAAHVGQEILAAEGDGKVIARLGKVLYWVGLGIASLCEIAAITVFLILITNHAASEAWMAVAFFAIVGGLAWLVGRAAKYVLAGI